MIYFRDQQITPEQHLAFARRSAPIDINRFFKPVGRPSGNRRGAQGGNVKAADLSGRIGNAAAVTRDVVHPAVIRHLDTGWRTLYANAAFTTRFDGWTAAESAPLLKLLCEQASKPEFSCRISWQDGSPAF